MCLVREEFWSLGLLWEMDSNVSIVLFNVSESEAFYYSQIYLDVLQIGNACMNLICEMARQIGKDIYIEDFYVVPVWKQNPQNIVTRFPEDADMKDLLVFPSWTNANGPDHYVVCVRNNLRHNKGHVMIFLFPPKKLLCLFQVI